MSEPVSDPSQFGVVVLNYNDHESTVTCVKSLLACDPAPRQIIVVDNESPNGSLAILQSALAGLETVEVVGSGHNGGYSFGNNVGIRRLREAGFRHVIIATSDTEVKTPDLLVLLAAATSSSTGVVSPQIITGDTFDNPSTERLTLRALLDLWWLRLGMPMLTLRRRLAYLVRKLFRLKSGRGRPGPGDRISVGPPRHVYKVHGAFLCLTDSYLTKVGELDDSIFMFGEEDLLAWHCLRNGLNQTLVPEALVHHAQDSSINLTWGRKAESFVDTQQKNSCRVLRREISMLPLVKSWLKGYPQQTGDRPKP